MKREFLQNFKVGDAELPKEVIDAIMEENGRDIEREKAKYADYDVIKKQLVEANETIKGYQSLDIDAIKKSAQDWEKKYNDAIAAHEQEKAETAFQSDLKSGIAEAKGRNEKAIAALLDLETLRKSQNRVADIKTAIEAVKKENNYLFESDETPPPYAGGAGQMHFGSNDPAMAAIRAAAGLETKGDK